METYALRLCEELAKRVDLEVFSLPGQTNGQPPSVWSLLTFPFVVIHRWRLRSSVPEIIHLGDAAIWPFGIFARAFAPKAGIIISAHGTDVSYSKRGGLRGNLYHLYQSLGARLLSQAKVVANSAATAEACMELGWKNISIVALATDFSPPARPSAIDSTSGTILFAGRLIRRKGLSWFVENVLPSLPSHLHLAVAGTGWDERELDALSHPRVQHLGALAQDELCRWFASALCIVVPNIELTNGEFEGFGLVACEGASAGGVVVASATGGLISAVRNGETGFLLPPGNADAWKETILEISKWTAQKRQDFVIKSSMIAITHYSWKRVADETCQIYEAAMAGHRA